MPLIFDQNHPPQPEDKDLKWAIGATKRTTFVWTIAPPGTEFTDPSSATEDYYLSIFKWADPFWSALDIRIDEDFISFLRNGHRRKEFNEEFQGQDYDYVRAPGNARQRPLPLGNHVISICLAAGIVLEKPRGSFTLRADWLSKSAWQQIDAVTEALQQYLETVQVPREQIVNHPRYVAKREQANRYAENQLISYVETIWKKANVSQMDDIPSGELFRDLIWDKLIGQTPRFYDDSGRQLSPEEVEKEAGNMVRWAWMEVRREIAAEHKKDDPK